MKNQKIEIVIKVDTVYGPIHKYGLCPCVFINSKEQLINHLKSVLLSTKSAVLSEFEKLQELNEGNNDN